MWEKLHRWERPLLVLIVSGALWLQCIGAWQDSQTTDEAAHLGAGASYWATGNFQLNPEHPPLIKLLAAAPVFLIPGVQVPLESPNWKNADQWNFGAEFLYANFEELDAAKVILFFARLPMILVWLVLGCVIIYLARKRWGPVGGLLSATFYAYDPTLLGHGHLVTTDLGVSLLYFTTIWAFDHFWRQPSWKWLTITELLFAGALLAKFSALLLWFVLPVLATLRVVTVHTRLTWTWWWRLIGVMIVATPILIWSMYGFEIKRIDADPRIDQLWRERQELIDQGILEQQTDLVQKLVRWTDPATPSGAWLSDFLTTEIPGYSYLRGVFSTLTHNYVGHSAYLLGQVNMLGWWYYFPIAFAVKMPIVTLAMLLAALGFAIFFWRRDRTSWFEISIGAFPFVLYLGWSMLGHINIGIRHIFPLFPFLFFWIGSLARPWPIGFRWQPLLLSVAMLGIISTSLLAWPHTIGYFNAFAGGTNGGHRYVLDSNLDWNQDIWRLRDWLEQEKPDAYHLSLFGSIPRKRLFPDAIAIPTDEQIRAGLDPAGKLIIISAGQLWNVDGPYHWLQPREPDLRLGSSILIFDFR